MMSGGITNDETRVRELIGHELSGLVELRRALHAKPELMFEERETSARVTRELEAIGLTYKAGLAAPKAGDVGTGVLAHLPATEGGGQLAVALRADMDALPIVEETGAAHASTTPGVMHACGHDGHTTILIGAARVLAKLEHRPNPVTFVFQPAEEGGAGGDKMVRDGALAGEAGGGLGPKVARIYGLHGWPQLPLGVVSTRSGPMLASTDEFEVVIHGSSGHAAWPHGAADPIVAAAAVIQALQTIVSRNTAPLDSAVVTVGAVHAGEANNVIPATAMLRGTVRSLRDETRVMAKRRFFEIVEGVAASMGCRAEIDWEEGYPVTANDAGEAARVEAIARQALGDARFEAMVEPVMGGEDFSYYGSHAAACFFTLGVVPEGVSIAEAPQLHQATYDFNDDAIATGVEMMVRLALS